MESVFQTRVRSVTTDGSQAQVLAEPYKHGEGSFIIQACIFNCNLEEARVDVGMKHWGEYA